MKIPINGPFGPIVFYMILMQWGMGVVLAKGFWQTLFTLFPPYGLYVSLEYTAKFFGFIP